MLRNKIISGIGNEEPIPLIMAAIVAKQAEAMSMRMTLMESQNSKVKSQNGVTAWFSKFVLFAFRFSCEGKKAKFAEVS